MTGRALTADFPGGALRPLRPRGARRTSLSTPTATSDDCCVHCDAELDPGELRWVPEAELERRSATRSWRERRAAAAAPAAAAGAADATLKASEP